LGSPPLSSLQNPTNEIHAVDFPPHPYDVAVTKQTSLKKVVWYDEIRMV